MLDRDEILMNEITGSNDWKKISKMNLSNEDLIDFRHKLNWYKVFVNKDHVDNSILDLLLEEGIISKENWSVFSLMQKKHVTSIDFVKKHLNILDIEEIAYKQSFTAKQLIELFGKPEVGSGVTQKVGFDRNPYTVIESKKNTTTIKIQLDDVVKVGSYNIFDDKYTYIENKSNPIITIRLNRRGRWTDKYGNSYGIGYRQRRLNLLC